ncbi:MAG: hypothetical protein WD872_14040, partial [Pirellulaceae bacterium]
MTNEQLVELLQQKTPEELTPAQIELLRGRLAESAELRAALAGGLHIDTYLSAALGQVHISPEQISARSRQHSAAGSSSVLVVLAALVCLPLVLLLGAVLVSALRSAPQQVAVSRPTDAQQDQSEAEPPAPQDDANPTEPDVEPPPEQPKPAATEPAPEVEPPAEPGAPAAPAAPPWQAALDDAG